MPFTCHITQEYTVASYRAFSPQHLSLAVLMWVLTYGGETHSICTAVKQLLITSRTSLQFPTL